MDALLERERSPSSVAIVSSPRSRRTVDRAERTGPGVGATGDSRRGRSAPSPAQRDGYFCHFFLTLELAPQFPYGPKHRVLTESL